MVPDLKPGQVALEGGQYEVVGPRGGKRGREVNSVEGKRLPPTSESGERYRLVDATKHQRGKR
ncbi:MAG: hypothetical protein LC732_10630 [Acidobacteria bacterium]|nr:hypothetical protein [Acidobacteriota bacterium]